MASAAIVFYNYTSSGFSVVPGGNIGPVYVDSGASASVMLASVDYNITYPVEALTPGFTITKDEIANFTAKSPSGFACYIVDYISRTYPIANSTVSYGNTSHKISDIHSPALMISSKQGLTLTNMNPDKEWVNARNTNWWFYIIAIFVILLIIIAAIVLGIWWKSSSRSSHGW